MTRNDVGQDDAGRDEARRDQGARPGHRQGAPPGIAGIIEGSMTMHYEPAGSVSFRVLIGTGGGRAADGDLLELIIGVEHLGELSRVLASPGAAAAADPGSPRSFPCHIGFCRNAVTNAE